jgi:hypothetical protein
MIAEEKKLFHFLIHCGMKPFVGGEGIAGYLPGCSGYS